MKIVINGFFKIVMIIESVINKYRFDYYCFKYKNNLKFGGGIVFGASTAVVMYSQEPKLSIGSSCDFRRNCLLSLDGSGSITIRDKNFFNNGCSINCLGIIEIGEGNLFGENVKIYDHNHVYTQCDIPIREQGFNIGKVKIGKNCWIGSNCVILNNVEIGDNVVIGANNLIYKHVPANSIIKSVAALTAKSRL